MSIIAGFDLFMRSVDNCKNIKYFLPTLFLQNLNFNMSILLSGVALVRDGQQVECDASSAGQM